MPLLTKKRGGKIVIVNLQTTKQDKQAYLKINGYVDAVMLELCSKLGVVVPKWTRPVVLLKSIHEPGNNEPRNELPNIVVDSTLLPSEKSETLGNGLRNENNSILFSKDHDEGKLSDTDTKRISVIVNDNDGVSNYEQHRDRNYKSETVITKKESTSIKSEAYNGQITSTGNVKEENDMLLVSANDETKSKVFQRNEVQDGDFVIQQKFVENYSFPVCNKKTSADGDEESRITDHEHKKEQSKSQENFQNMSKISVIGIPCDTEEPQSKIPKYSCDIGEV